MLQSNNGFGVMGVINHYLKHAGTNAQEGIHASNVTLA